MEFRIFFYFVLVCLSKINAQSSCGISGKFIGLVVNGTASKQGAWPWIISVHSAKNEAYFCGGTLIGPNAVLTAAHCIQEKNKPKPKHPTEIIIKLGKFNLSEPHERGSEIRYPREIIIHPNWKYYDPVKYDSDIAFILLDSTVKITDSIFPICLWSESSDPKENKGVIVGWGKSERGGKHEIIPRQLEVFIRSNAECLTRNPALAYISSVNTFCAGKDMKSGACNGDSGSGLFVRSGSTRWYLRGIISAALNVDGTCDVKSDVIFTNVLKFTDWIKKVASSKKVSLPKPDSDVNSLTVFKPRNFNKEIFCFFESWAVGRQGDGSFSFQHLRPELCTFIVFLHAELRDDNLKSINTWQQTDENGEKLFKAFTDLKKSHGVKTLLSIGSWNEGSVKYSQLAADPSRRKRFAVNSAEFLKEYGFDGLHFHWEHPAHRGGAIEDKENFVHLLKELHDVYKPQNLYLSSLVRVQKDVVEKAYDLENIAKYVNAVLMMTFDLAGPWDGKVGFHAPLRGAGDNNIESRVNYFMSLGVPADKIVLGIPFFGRTFSTDNNGNIGDTTSNDSGFPGPFFNENGFLGYNEMCSMRRDNNWDISFDKESSQAIGKFKYKEFTNVVTFDSPRSVANKVKFLMEKNLAGVWTWFVDSDDFRGYCKADATTFADFPNVKAPQRQESDYPLLRTINEAMELLTSKDVASNNTLFIPNGLSAGNVGNYSLHDVHIFSE